MQEANDEKSSKHEKNSSNRRILKQILVNFHDPDHQVTVA